MSYMWRVQRSDNDIYETTISSSEPIVAPSDSGEIIRENTVILESYAHEGYLNLESNLADSQAIKINASHLNGGIDIDAGTGGINIDTTSTVSINANEQTFTTITGNLELESASLININGSTGINIGNDTNSTSINIGTGVAEKTITIGNTVGETVIDGGFTVSGGGISLNATGESSNLTLTTTGDDQDFTLALTGSNNSSIILDSEGTGTDSIKLNTVGGIDIDATNKITFDAGEITINSGNQGTGINSEIGNIGIGDLSAGNINIGTSETERTITMGNTTDATSMVLEAGTGGITINSGVIGIGNDSSAKNITIGNSTSTSSLSLKWGTGGLIKYQPSHTSLSNSNNTLTISQIITEIIIMTPTKSRTVTLPTAELAVAGITGVEVNDAIDFRIINLGLGLFDPKINIAMGSGGTSIGRMYVDPYINNLGTYLYSGTGIFRMRFINVTEGNEEYIVYRIG